MKNKIVIAILFICSGSLLVSFINGVPGYIITEKDVELKIPKSFPKPFYDFSKNKLSPEIFSLGRKLFYDEILSKDNTISCASCHQRIAAFAHIDHRLSHGIYGKIGTRNVPALQNLIWKDAFMWDGGVNHLEIQPLSPMTSKIEMDETAENVIKKLQANREYVSLFTKAFKDSVVTSQKMLKALTQFTGLMISSNSRYDKFLAKKDTFSAQEKNGLKLFRKKCAGCHKEPLFTDNSYRDNGIVPDTSLKDAGRGKITGYESDKNKFKVPGLRNVEMTYPYMHDGRFRNLIEVLKHYGTVKSHSVTADKSVSEIGTLSDHEIKDLVAFLKTLTDREFLYDRRFSNPFEDQ